MSRHYITSSMLLTSIVSAALISGCGAMGGSMDAADQDLLAAPASYDAPPEGGSDNHITAPQPVLPDESKGASDWFDMPDIEIPLDIIDWDAWWESLHIAVTGGENDLPLDEYMMASSNVSEQLVITGYEEVFPGIIIPILGPGLKLAAGENEMAYAMFGLKDVPAGQNIVNVHLAGTLTPGSGDEHGVYIGISNYNTDAYKWYGPVDLSGGEADQSTYFLNCANEAAHAYLVIAVWDGDEFVMSDLDVTIDTLIDIPDFDIPEIPAFEL